MPAKIIPEGDLTPVLKLRCVVSGVTDGDTITANVVIPARIRLLNCWAPESRGPHKSPAGQASKQAMLQLVEEHPTKAGLLTIPLDGITRLDEIFTMGRILALVHLDNAPADLSTLQVRSGHATTEKPDP